MERHYSEVLSALRWYFESKNLALKNALSFRCPLSVEQQRELRQYYSEYFVSLVSATELLLDSEYSHRDKFKESLERTFVFDLLPDGEGNYSYIRELRNSIIHRGLDVCSAAHVNGDFLLVVAPSSVSNKTGKKSFQALGFYLLNVISKCEGVIGQLIARHLDEVGFLKSELTQDRAVENARRFISESNAMPEWVKQLAHDTIATIDHVEVQVATIKSLVDVLCTNALSSTDAQQVAQRLPASGQPLSFNVRPAGV